MIGDMLSKIRKEKRMTKTELARLTGINIGHLTHIEKGERNPSHKALRNICKALDIPYQQLMLMYDKIIGEEQEDYDVVNLMGYDKVLAVESVSGFINCPAHIPSASIALKVNDDSMDPTLKANSYVFVEFNSPLSNGEIGLFNVNNDILIRKFYSKSGKITLKADNKKYDDIKAAKNDSLYIIGKIFV